jgi:hypothetical protein
MDLFKGGTSLTENESSILSIVLNSVHPEHLWAILKGGYHLCSLWEPVLSGPFAHFLTVKCAF